MTFPDSDHQVGTGKRLRVSAKGHGMDWRSKEGHGIRQSGFLATRILDLKHPAQLLGSCIKSMRDATENDLKEHPRAKDSE